MVPQVGQGALAVECRADDDDTQARSRPSSTGPAAGCVDAERAFLAELGGDCDLPAGAHATVEPDGQLRLTAVLAAEDGTVHRHAADGDDPVALGTQVARTLRAALPRTDSA